MMATNRTRCGPAIAGANPDRGMRPSPWVVPLQPVTIRRVGIRLPWSLHTEILFILGFVLGLIVRAVAS
jgi:hypothetical protein